MSEIKLSKLQKDILKFFGKDSFGRNFYWTGGTLLAYFYFHHRLSVDLDFFSDDLFADDQYLEFINRLKKSCDIKKVTLNLEHNRRIYLIERPPEAVKIELVFFPFRAVEKRKNIKEFSLAVDSLTDITINKTLSTYQRNEPKDVYDLYYYLSRGPKYDLFELVRLVEKKFGVAIQTPLLFAKINELADNLGKLQPLLTKRKPNLTKKVKEFFQSYFNRFARKIIK